LAAAAVCFDSCINPGLQPAVQTYLLAQLYQQLVPTANIDPKALAQAAAAFTTLDGFQAQVQTFILCNIATAVGA
jgi:hypothetical protein